MSNSVGNISDFVRTQLARANRDEQTGAQIGSNLSNLEDGLLELYAKGEWGSAETADARFKYLQDRGLTDLIDTKTENKTLLERIPSMEGIRKAVELKYQRASRGYEGFMTLLKNSNEIILRAIQNIRVG